MDDEISGPHRDPLQQQTSMARAEIVVRDVTAEPKASHRIASTRAPSAGASHGLRDRATAGAASLGAAALLVLSFGPAALAVDPSGPTIDPAQGSSWDAPLDLDGPDSLPEPGHGSDATR